MLGFAVALALQNVTRGKSWLRVAFALPMLLPPIAVSFAWKMLFDFNRGPVNYFLGLSVCRRSPGWLARSRR